MNTGEIEEQTLSKALYQGILEAAENLKGVIHTTPLQYHKALSALYECEVYLKREDLQVVRSYKVRGAYNYISQLSEEQKAKGIICASTGNHAQGFAYSCQQLKIRGAIYMPNTTPNQKIQQVKYFGGQWIEIVMRGDTFDDCLEEALEVSKKEDLSFVPAFDHPLVMAGQGTIGLEILNELPNTDYVFIPIGGGGLAAGIGSWIRTQKPEARLIGVEPVGSPTMYEAWEAGEPVEISLSDKFVDGVAVKKAGRLTYPVCREVLDRIVLCHEGKVCSNILDFYSKDAIVLEPAGALALSALDQFREEIKGKKVVCILSGGNNDLDRLYEIKERALMYEGLKHYFIIRFAQRPGALKSFMNEVLGEGDNITRFEYIQRHHKEKGPALVGIELRDKEDYKYLIGRMKKQQVNYIALNEEQVLYEYLV